MGERGGLPHRHLQVQQARSSNVVSHTIAMGGALVRNDINVVLDGEGGGKHVKWPVHGGQISSISTIIPALTMSCRIVPAVNSTRGFSMARHEVCSMARSSSIRTPNKPTPGRPIRICSCPQMPASTPNRNWRSQQRRQMLPRINDRPPGCEFVVLSTLARARRGGGSPPVDLCLRQ